MSKGTDLLKYAKDLYNNGPQWITFFREMLSPGTGQVYKCFPNEKERERFKKTSEYKTICDLAARLKVVQDTVKDENNHDELVTVTVRMPSSLHEMLRDEKKRHNMSINKIIVTKCMLPLPTTEQ